jgi:uncharacterized protein YjdB
VHKRLIKKLFAAVLCVAMVFNINIFTASAAESIKVNNVYTNVQKLTMATGTKKQITTYTEPEDATNQKMRFTSSSNKVAKVTQSGVVTAVAPGTATITVTARDGSKASEKITVNVLKNLVIDKSKLDSDGEVIVLDEDYGNVTIDNSVGSADIYLSGVKIKNKLSLEKGNYNVYLYESNANTVEVVESTSEIKSFAMNSNTGIPGLFVYNNSEVNGVNATTGLNFAQDDTSAVNTLTYEYSGDADLDLNLDGFLGNIVINVTGKGSINYNATGCNIQNVTVTGSNNSGSVQFSNAAESLIANLTVGGSANVNLQVPATTLNISNDAVGSRVTVGAPVTTLNNNGSNTNLSIGAPITTLISAGQGGNIQVQNGGKVEEKELSTGTAIKDNTPSGGAIGGTIGGLPAAPGKVTIEAGAEYFNEDFEDGYISNIGMRGNVAISIVDDGTGNKALLVSGRTQTYQGAAVGLAPFTVAATNKHVTVSFTADVMYTDGPATATMGATVESGGYSSVASATVSKGVWTTISGTYLVNGSTPLLYIELDNTNNYYVDNVRVTLQTVTDLVPVESITMDKATALLGVSETTKLTATVLPTNAESRSVTWFSSDPAVASVDSTGLVKALKGGTTTITARSNYGGMEAKTVVTVDPSIKVYAISMNKEVVVLTQLGTTQLTATSTLNTAPFASTITWDSSDDAVATVSSTGLVTAVANGTAFITASFTVNENGVAMTLGNNTRIVVDTQAKYVNTYDDPAGAIGFSQMGNASLSYEDGHVKASGRTAGYEGGSLSTGEYNGKEIRITADVKHGSGSPTNVKITYNAGSTYKTVIDSGNIPVGEWATITGTIIVDNASSKVYFESNNATCDLYYDNVIISEVVWAPTPISSVTLNKDTLTLNAGLEETLVGTIAPVKVTTSKVLNWSSSDTNVATVDSTGKVTAKAPGSAIITVKTTIDGVSTVAYEDTCTVTVTAAVPKPADPIVEDFEGMTVGTTLTWLSYGGADVATVIVDPNDPNNQLLEVKPSNYNCAPIIKLTIPTGNTLYDYSKISYKAVWLQGAVGWKPFRVEADSKLTGQINDDNRLIASFDKASGATTTLQANELTLSGKKSELAGNFELSLGISCPADDKGVPTIYYLDDITLIPKTPKPSTPVETVIMESGFEDQVLVNNSSSNFATSTAAARTGNHSLLVSNSDADYKGPEFTLSTDGTYTVTAYVKTVSGSAIDYAFMNTSTYDEYSSRKANSDTAWTQIQGTVAVSGSPVTLRICAKSASATNVISYYIDDFSVTDSGNAVVMKSGFEDITMANNSGASFSIASTDKRTGNNSLFVNAADQNWRAPEFTISAAGTYTVSAYVKSANGSQEFSFMNSSTYDSYSSTKTNDGSGWTLITGTVVVPSGGSTIRIRCITASSTNTVSYYIDDFKVVQ